MKIECDYSQFHFGFLSFTVVFCTASYLYDVSNIAMLKIPTRERFAFKNNDDIKGKPQTTDNIV